MGDGLDNDCDGFIDEWASLSEGEDLSGDEAHLHLGWSLSVAGDVDGDGITDLLAGTASTLGSTRGVLAYLFSGPFTPDLDLARAVITGDVPVPGTGATLAGAGDTNGDGFADFLVGDSDRNPGRPGAVVKSNWPAKCGHSRERKASATTGVNPTAGAQQAICGE